MNSKNIKEFVMITFGVFLIAVGIVYFRNPNKFAFGGTSGIALIMTHYFPSFSVGFIMTILNTFLIVLGYALLGPSFGLKTIYGTYSLSFFMFILEKYMPITGTLTNQTFMEMIYAVFIPGLGGALVFNSGATTGGTDIVAKIICKFTSFKLSQSVFISDILIASFAGFAFGKEALLFSIMGVFIKSVVLDSVLESLNQNKVIVIISTHTELVKNFICVTMKRGATVHKASGAFTTIEKEVITTVLSKKEALVLQKYLHSIDPEAFITITNSSKIIGKGFGQS